MKNPLSLSREHHSEHSLLSLEKTVKRTVLLFWLGSALASGQAVPQVASDELLTINSPRPLFAICNTLWQRFGWQVTYEENAYDPVTEITHPAGEPKLLVPRFKSTAYRLRIGALSDPRRATATERRDVLLDLVQQHHESGNPGNFAVVQDGEFTQILPASVVAVGGKREAFQPILDTVVSPHVAGRAMGEEIRSLVAQVSALGHGSVMLGTIPTNLFIQERALFDVPGPISARQAVRELLSQTGLHRFGGPPRLVWALTYDPNSGGYYLNIVLLPQAPVSSQPALQLAPEAAKPSPSAGSKTLQRR